MANIYRAPDVTPQKPKNVQKAAEKKVCVDEIMHRAADDTNLCIVSGVKKIRNSRDNENPWRQPFWFVHERGEMTGIYIEAEKVHTHSEQGALKMHFKTVEAQERLCDLLVNYYASGRSVDVSIINFGSSRGFCLKTAHEQPRDPRGKR